jgi:hypothetical protein
MSAAELYDPSQIKSGRVRATRAETDTRRRRVFEIVEEDHPMTVRQVYYRAVVLGLIGKTEQDYLKIQNDLTELRRRDKLPYDWLIDEGRRPRKSYSAEGIVQALNDTRHNYRKDPCQEIDEYVQIWVEKNALAGVIEPVTDEYHVALMAAVGYSSITFAYEAAQFMKDLGHPIYVYHFGDYDPSGVDAARAIEQELRLHAPEAEIHFERVAVTPVQIAEWRLPTRPTKTSDPRAKKFGSDTSVELDAIRPRDLRDLVRKTIERHLSRAQLDTINALGEQEKLKIGRMLDQFLDELHEPEPIAVCRNGGPANGPWIDEYLTQPDVARRPAWSNFGSDHVDALYPARGIKIGGDR